MPPKKRLKKGNVLGTIYVWMSHWENIFLDEHQAEDTHNTNVMTGGSLVQLNGLSDGVSISVHIYNNKIIKTNFILSIRIWIRLN